MSSDGGAADTSGARGQLGLVEYSYWAFLLIAVGRVNQLIPHLGSLPLAKLCMGLTVLALFTQRRKSQPMSPDAWALARTGLWLAGVSVALTPFSFWPGRSFGFATSYLPVVIATVALAAMTRSSWVRLRGTLLVLVGSGLTLAALGVLNHSAGSRADVSDTMYDPNDLAYMLVTLLPLAMAFYMTTKELTWRIAYAGAGVVILMGLLLTESRGGLLGLLTIVALMTFAPMNLPDGKVAKNSLLPKLRVLMVVICFGVVVWTLLPESAQMRFATLLHLNNDYDLNMQDRTGRGDIWMRGLTAFGVRPWGYGPESYEMVDLTFGGQFKVAHNSLLQMLVELGALGLFFYLKVYYLGFRGLQRARAHLLSLATRTADQDAQAVFARAFQISLAGNFISGGFLSEGYSEILWSIMGCCMAVIAIAVTKPLAAAETAAATAAPTPKAVPEEAVPRSPYGRRPPRGAIAVSAKYPSDSSATARYSFKRFGPPLPKRTGGKPKR